LQSLRSRQTNEPKPDKDLSNKKLGFGSGCLAINKQYVHKPISVVATIADKMGERPREKSAHKASAAAPTDDRMGERPKECHGLCGQTFNPDRMRVLRDVKLPMTLGKLEKLLQS
jgi:hypothetical protein